MYIHIIHIWMDEHPLGGRVHLRWYSDGLWSRPSVNTSAETWTIITSSCGYIQKLHNSENSSLVHLIVEGYQSPAVVDSRTGTGVCRQILHHLPTRLSLQLNIWHVILLPLLLLVPVVPLLLLVPCIRYGDSMVRLIAGHHILKKLDVSRR